MKVDFSTVLKDLAGNDAEDNEGKVTLSKVAAVSLLTSYPDEQNLPATEKLKRGRLAEITYKGGEQDMSPEDLAVIRALIAKGWGPLVVLQAFRLTGGE